MGEDTQHKFVLLGFVAAGGQGGAWAALVLAEGALDMPALVTGFSGEVFPSCPAIGCFGWIAAGVARVERDDRLAQAQFFPAKAMVVLGIISRVGQSCFKGDQARSLPHGWDRVGRVLAWPYAWHSAHDHMGGRVHNGAELRPGPLSVSRPIAPQPEMGAHMAGQSHCVHGGNRGCGCQAHGLGTLDQRGLSPAERPPFLGLPCFCGHSEAFTRGIPDAQGASAVFA